MLESQLLLDALLDHGPRDLAIREARRARASRRRRNLGLAALAIVTLALTVAKFDSRPDTKTTPTQASTQPTLHIFSTTGAAAPLPAFSTPANARPLALFSSRDEPLAIRSIDDHTLLELLQPYGPVIVRAAPGVPPSLLLLNRQ